MPSTVPDEVYCDGGLIGPGNPSKHGGTWAWCWVRSSRIVRKAGGVIGPEDIGMPGVSNNVSELFAAIMALESVPPDWWGVLHTDSLVTLRRITTGHKFNGVPPWLIQRTLAIRASHQSYFVQLVGGHPTQAELLSGKRERNGLKVSRFNVAVDEECCRLSRRFKENHL